MIRHYLTLTFQAAALDQALRGRHLAECWSSEKNTLNLRFIHGDASLFVEISLDLQAGYLLIRDDCTRSRRNTLDFFGNMVGSRLEHVRIDEGERIVRFAFASGDILAVFLFGRGGGNALHLRDGNLLSSYRRYGGEYDELLDGRKEEREIDRHMLAREIRSGPTVEKGLAQGLPELGRRLAVEAAVRASIDPHAVPASLDDTEINHLLLEADRLYADCQVAEEFHLYHLESEAVFSLIPLQSLEPAALRHERFNMIGPAIRGWRSVLFTRRRQAGLRHDLLRRIDYESARLERALAHRRDGASHRARADEWERAANVIMSNLYRIEKGTRKITLDDWEGKEMEIELNETLSPVENADRYFRKARGARIQAERGERGVEKTVRQIESLRRLRGRIDEAGDPGSLEKIAKENPGLTMKEGERKATGGADRFRRFEVAGGCEVFAGKSAANNDELTVRFAKPNDYWFHARGSSGSHVVLRWGDSKTKPPREAILQAASIAAYYSGSRNAKMTPVAYTLKKYVRKPRGAAPGAVLMEREKVVMVEPKLPVDGDDYA